MVNLLVTIQVVFVIFDAELALTYQSMLLMVRDDPKLPADSGIHSQNQMEWLDDSQLWNLFYLMEKLAKWVKRFLCVP